MAEINLVKECKCCDQVLEEIKTVRRILKKYFHYFFKQIEALRVESVDFAPNENLCCTSEYNLPNESRIDARTARTSKESCSSSASNLKKKSKSSSVQPKQKSKIYKPPKKPRADEPINYTSSCIDRNIKNENDEPAIEFCDILSPILPNYTIGAAQEYEHQDALLQSYDNQFYPSFKENITGIDEGSAIGFFNVKPRVLPNSPFESVAEFEAWDALLKTDPNQNHQLRTELMEGHFTNANYYIRHIWRCLFRDDVAESFTYRGNVKTNKKALKDYVFTHIFQNCFQQRFPDCDLSVFNKRTICFFNYANDQIRRAVAASHQNGETSLDIEFC